MSLTTFRKALLVILTGLAIGAVSLIGFSEHHGDLKLYYSWSAAAIEGHFPYRDFPFEYPPLALVPLVIPRLLILGATISLPVYTALFLLENCLLLMEFAWVLHRNKGLLVQEHAGANQQARMGAAVFLASSPILFWRYDLFPVVLTWIGLIAVLNNKPAQAGLWLGIAVATKLYPIVLVPVVGVMYLATGQYARLIRFLGAGLLVLGTTTALVWYGAGPESGQFLTYHLKRGINIDAVASSLISIGHLLTQMPLEIVLNYGSANLVTLWEPLVVSILTPLFLLAYLGGIGLSYYCFHSAHRNHQPQSPGLIAGCLAVSILLFIVSAKFFLRST